MSQFLSASVLFSGIIYNFNNVKLILKKAILNFFSFYNKNAIGRPLKCNYRLVSCNRNPRPTKPKPNRVEEWVAVSVLWPVCESIDSHAIWHPVWCQSSRLRYRFMRQFGQHLHNATGRNHEVFGLVKGLLWLSLRF